MQNEDLELEAELKRLRPKGPSTELLQRLGRELDQTAIPTPRLSYTSSTSWRSWKWQAWTACATAVVVFGLVAIRFNPTKSVRPREIPSAFGPTSPADLIADLYKPVRADKVLYSAEEEEAVTLMDGTSARRVRAQYVDTITWKNPRTNASVRWSVPREEVRVIPVSYQ